MLGYVGLCKAIERNVFHILANGEPLYDAYTTYLPIWRAAGDIRPSCVTNRPETNSEGFWEQI